MPLIKRSVRPTDINRGHLTTEVAQAAFGGSISNELELTTNGSLACVVLQLSSLSRHVEDMFSELHRETLGLHQRTCHLGDRIDRLKVKITQLNPTVEEVLLQDINTRKPFKSSIIKDQQIITLATRPVSIQEVYLRCEPPPALQKLNPYRQDGKDSLKFYTDDTYFFELWRIAMQKESKTQLKKHKQRSKQPYMASDGDSLRSGASSVDAAGNSRMIADTQRSDKLPRPATDSRQLRGDAARAQSDAARIQRPPPSTEQSNVIIVDQKILETGRRVHAGKILAENMQQRHPVNQYETRDAGVTRAGLYRTVENNVHAAQLIEASQRPADLKVCEDLQPTQVSIKDCNSSSAVSSHPQQTMSPASDQRDLVVENSVVSDGAELNNKDRSRGIDVVPIDAEAFIYDVVQPRPGSTKSSTPDSADFLPPPPTPPPLSHPPDSPGSLPPPPTPPPPLDYNRRQSGDLASDHIPVANFANVSGRSELPVTYAAVAVIKQPGEASVARMLGGEMSGYIELSKMSKGDFVGGKGEFLGGKDDGLEEPRIRDTRSDLLSAIREGIQLRKVEERRLQTEKRSRQPGRLDVQTIMETAFELRRKALEDTYDDEDDGPDANWSDED